MSKELIRLHNLCMAFDDELVLDNINLYINDSEFLTLLGPSGCGKTTTLRIIGGFTTPTSGDVTFDGVRINDVPPHKRQINTVFQKYALFPHLNVYENIAFGPRLRGMEKKELHEKLRTHSLAASAIVKEQGGENDLVDRIAADEAFKITKEEIMKVLKPENYIGRCPEQVDAFLSECIMPVLNKHKDILGEKTELSV